MDKLKTSQLKERCDRLQRQLELRKIVTPEEAKEINAMPKRSRDDWWERFAVLKSYARRLEFEKHKNDDNIAKIDTEAVRMRMLLAQPIPVILDDGKTYDVHPKSYNALCMVISIDYAIAWLAEMANGLATEGGPNAPGYLPRIAEQIGRLQNIMCDVILFPGAGFDMTKLEDPTPYDFSTLDLIALQRAHNEVNVVRMLALPMVTNRPKDSKTRETGWSAFFVILGMKRSVDPITLINDVALTKLIAEARIKADAETVDEKDAA